MDLDKTIERLRDERERLDAVIIQLEKLQKARTSKPPVSPKRPGRKSMGEAERKIVSERIKDYWAQRRKLSQKD